MKKLRDVVSKAQEKNMVNETPETVNNPARYGCEVILEKTTLEKANDKTLPNDAYLIWYNVDQEQHIDLVRGTRVHIFDMYYDKYGPGSVKNIDFGYGRVNPRIWGYKEPEKKRRR
jgi:hypothetical protein